MTKRSVRIFFLCTMAFICLNITGQSILIYDFNDCDLMEANGLSVDLFSPEPIDCQCGVIGDGIYMDDVGGFIRFPFDVNQQIAGDFTLSFYFQIEDKSQSVNILRLMRNCTTIDSSLTITYNSSTDQINVLMVQDFSKLVELNGSLNPDNCWHHFVLGRRGLEFFLYIDNSLEERILTNASIAIADSVEMVLGEVNCGISGLRGKVDEFVIADSFLEGSALEALTVGVDQILNPDTTIFLGDMVDIRHGGSCDPNPLWTPSGNVSPANVIDPIISPVVSTTYFLDMNNGFCTARDSIRINVIDADDIDCGELLLPTAFTPNGDNLNDMYLISNGFILDELESFAIFDRWGGRVFETMDKHQGWDGNFKGTVVNSGTYVYKIKYSCKTEEHFKIGSFTVIR